MMVALTGFMKGNQNRKTPSYQNWVRKAKCSMLDRHLFVKGNKSNDDWIKYLNFRIVEKYLNIVRTIMQAS